MFCSALLNGSITVVLDWRQPLKASGTAHSVLWPWKEEAENETLHLLTFVFSKTIYNKCYQVI